MNLKTKRKIIKKICRAQYDWHINASGNWDDDRFFEATKGWDISNAAQFQKYLNRRFH